MMDIDILDYLQFLNFKGYQPSKVTIDKAISEIESLRAKLAAQPTPSQSVSEDLFAEWWSDHHIDFNHNDILRACEIAFNAGQARAQLSKPQPQTVKESIKKIRALIQTEKGE